MPDRRRRNCRKCGRHESIAGSISWRGKCIECALELEVDAIEQMAAHNGPVFEHWRARLAASVGATLAPTSTEGT